MSDKSRDLSVLRSSINQQSLEAAKFRMLIYKLQKDEHDLFQLASELIPGLSFPLTQRLVNILGVTGMKRSLYCFEMKSALTLNPDIL